MLSQKKAFFGIMSTFLLLSVFVSAFNIQPVNAEETIYIRADGSVEPQSAPIQRNGDLYTLTDNITNYAANATIVVERNNSMVDGAGFTVKGQPWDREKGSSGICVNRTNNVTIQNTNFDNPYTGILLSYSSNASIKGNNLTRHDYGILLDSSFNSSIDGNTVTYSVNGIYLASSYSNSIDGNSLTETEGIRFNSSSNNIIKRNNITKNYGGIRFDFFSDYNSIEENTVASSYVGICLYVSSQHNSIRGNNVSNNSLGGIVFDSTSNYNGIYENTIENNTVGLVVSYAEALKLNAAYGTTLFVSFGDTSNNMFYHNNVITNSQQVNTSSSGYSGVWDDGYPSGGNYWSDYNGTDLFSGPYQNETGSDGIGDTPYIIDANNLDDYPLMHATFENQTIYSGPVYIRADGSIDPPTAPIHTADNVTYTLTGNFTADANGIVIERDNIIIDGNGHTLQGPGLYRYSPPEAIIAYGISLAGRENVTVQNTQITAFSWGIYLENSSNINVVGNNVTNSHRAIFLTSSSRSIVNGNSIAGQYIGINVFSSSNDNIICGNSIADSYGYGIDVYSSSNVSVVGNNMTNDWFGIELEYSSDNIISGNNMTNKDNSIVGINAYHSSNNAISGNCIANKNTGISIYYCSDNIITGNNITANKDSGIGLGFSSNISIGGNDVIHNGAGIFFNSSSSNSICGNNITDNSYGVKLYSSSDNKFYHNNLIGNVQQAFIGQSGYANVWDDGYPLGGNYWSDYNGTDLYSGPYQNETGSDGIGDVPYVIDGDNRDRFPLVSAVRLLTGDVNYDGIVDIYDAIVLAGAYSSVPGSSNWDPNADINRDNIVDIFDAILLASNFGRTL